jgi:cell wall-associated NlpC family hydrolase
MRRLLVMLALAGSSAHAAEARVSPIGPEPRSDSNALAHRVVAFAERQVGVRYRFGGISRSTGFDCSGLVYAAYRSIGRAIRTRPGARWRLAGE